MITDIIYDNRAFSELGYIPCTFDSSDGISAIDTDSQRSFNHLSLFDGKYQPFSTVNYDSPLSIQSQGFCKDPCEFSDDMYISLDEIRNIKRWLSPPTPKKLQVVDDRGEFGGVYWMGICNVTEVWNNDDRIGFQVTFESDRPYASGRDVEMSGTLAVGNQLVVIDTSDEQGHTYPYLKITCKSDGDLQINCNYRKTTTIIKNCKSGEVITFTPEIQVSSSMTHNLSDDFNWVFPIIGNTNYSQKNIITSPNMDIDYELSFTPSVKAVFA